MEKYLEVFEPVSYESGKTMPHREAINRMNLLFTLIERTPGMENKVRLLEEVYRVSLFTSLKNYEEYQRMVQKKYNEYSQDEHKALRKFRVKWGKYFEEGVENFQEKDWVGMDGEDDLKDKDWCL